MAAAVVVKARQHIRQWDGAGRETRWDVSFADSPMSVSAMADRPAVFAWARKQAARVGRTIRIDWLNEAGDPIRNAKEAGR